MFHTTNQVGTTATNQDGILVHPPISKSITSKSWSLLSLLQQLRRFWFLDLDFSQMGMALQQTSKYHWSFYVNNYLYIYIYTLQHHCEQILNYWRIMANDTQQTHSMAITIESWWSTDLMNSDEDFLNITIFERGKYMTLLFQKPWQGRSAKIASFAGWYFCFVTLHSPMIIHIQTSI